MPLKQKIVTRRGAPKETKNELKRERVAYWYRICSGIVKGM